MYIEHDWPTIWIIHAERREVEVLQKGLASVMYRMGTSVPRVPELDKFGMTSIPVRAFFDKHEADKYARDWVASQERAQERANGVLQILLARRIDVPASIRERIVSCNDLAALQRWFTLALTATNSDEFAHGMDEHVPQRPLDSLVLPAVCHNESLFSHRHPRS